MENPENNNGGGDTPAPQYIGNYEVLRTIGKGKFAIVYRARKIGDEQVVALKRISVDMMNEKAREKCLKEVRLLQNLDHPNIIHYMDSFITDNDLIIVYEWAAAGDLKRQLRKAQEKGTGFEERIIWKYFSQICMAMQHMHEKRIMHRDLKPANIFLTLDGTIKVGDLGLSRELSADTIQAHSKVGTPLYMSPEVLKGDGYDFKSDIWSLGCLLYELAMLKSPFKAEGLNLYSLFQKISNGEYLPLPDHYSEDLRNLAYSMINIRPEDRPEINQVVEIAKRMRQQTASNKGSLQRENSNGALTSQMAATVSSSLAPETEGIISTEIPSSAAPSNPPTNVGLTRTPSKSALEAKEEVLANRDSRSHENNPYGRRPESEEDKNPRQRSWKNEEKREDLEGRGQAENKVLDKYVGLDDYFQHKTQQEDDRKQRDRADSNQSRETWKPAAEKQSRQMHISTTATIEQPEYPPVLTPVPQEQVPSSSDITRSNVVRRSKPTAKSNETKAQARPFSGRQPHSGAGDIHEDRSQLASREKPSSNPDHIGSKQSTAIPEEIAQSGQALALMEVVYSKLVVLRYPMDDPDIKLATRDNLGRGRLLPIHFTCDPKAFGTVAGYERGYIFNSMSRLIHAVEFLCEKINVQALMAVQSIDKEFGSPMTSARQLLLAAQRAGELDEQVAAITPTSITQGYGFNVCVLLNHFADCALRAVNFQIKLPVHTTGLGPLDVPMEEDDDIEDLEAVEGEDEEDRNDRNSNELVASASGTLGGSKGKFYFAEMSSIDPELWKQEAERVTPLLRKHEASIGQVGGLSATWRSHLDLLMKHVTEVILGQPSRATKDAVSAFTSSNIADFISSLRTNLQESLQKIQHMEKLLCGRAAFTGFSLEYESYNKELQSLQEKCAELNTNVSASNATLAEIDDKLEEVAEQFEVKTSGEGGANAPTIKIKEAIRQLQQELNQMQSTISMLNHDLLQRRKESLYKKSLKRASKKNSSKAGIVDDDDILI